ncbi:hypothetical protein [Aquisalinus flavus]|uniref:Uncharacterized protein n=1 Tax=Aquisalinus flavus TaxID=1526572 RepID=A0A8J2Y7P9_9PROT|nr:hypothetical protein [Aquisalinus flavus]MBD0425249.1 hypothetical protein [Aquisalinus flavus]UNE49094.1 hypothetical protein FF099_14050 [Aquisalinus flavus]GGD17558.1 hypothetical protein GCM10011342_27960 [Aquisalinus flavus]
MLDTIVDIVLLLVSGSACLYCWLLSKRLKALQDLKKGLGASIVSLSEAISKTSIAAQEAKLSASHSADKLSRLLSDIDKSVPLVDDLIESVHRSTRRAANETTRMQDDAVAAIKPLLDEAKKTAADLASVIELINQRTTRLHAETLALDEKAETIARDTRERQALVSEIASLKMRYRMDDEAMADDAMAQTPAAKGETIAEIDPGSDAPAEQTNPFTAHISRLQALAAARREHEAEAKSTRATTGMKDRDDDEDPIERSA